MEQRFLLEAEGVRFKGKRVDLREFEHRFFPAKAKAAKGVAQRTRNAPKVAEKRKISSFRRG
jgi:hypothetical protein